MLPVLREAAKGETTVPQLRALIAAEFQLTPAQVEERIPSGYMTRLSSRLAWAKTYLLNAALVESPRRGVFRATDRGRSVLKKQPQKIDVRFLRQFAEFLAFEGRSNATGEGKPVSVPPPTEGGTPEERIDAAYRLIAANVREEILRRVQQASPRFFEHVVVDLLVAMGYGGDLKKPGRVVGGTGDHGIDGVVDQDALGLDVVYVQAKRYKSDSTVSEEQVHGFSGALSGQGAVKGVFVTTSRFSENARRFAQTVKHQKIVLIDGEQLAGLLVEHGIGVRTERSIAIKKIDLDYFEDEETGESTAGAAAS